MSKYIEEFGLKKVRNASDDPDKQADVSISNGYVTLNKVATDIICVKAIPCVEVYSGEQGGATVFALQFGDTETVDAVIAKVAKKGTTRIPLKVPLKKYGYSLKSGINVDVIDIDTATLVFSIGTIKKEEPQEKKPVERKGKPAPFGQMTTTRESVYVEADGTPTVVPSSEGGMGVPFADSDF